MRTETRTQQKTWFWRTNSCRRRCCTRALPGGRGWRIHYLRLPEPLPATPEALAAAINQAMETLIRRFPEQYLWSYNRYKEPGDAPPPPRRPDEPAPAPHEPA